jgi:hypothetical protein
MRLAYLLLCVCAAAYAAQAGEKPDFSGTWQIEPAGGEKETGATWVIEQHDSDIRIREMDKSGKVQRDVKCGTRGVECEFKLNGGDAKASYYFNGSTLVELLWKGKDVIKTQRTLSPDGTKLTVEVMQMTPPGDPEKMIYVKAAPAAATAVTESAAR